MAGLHNQLPNCSFSALRFTARRPAAARKNSFLAYPALAPQCAHRVGLVSSVLVGLAGCGSGQFLFWQCTKLLSPTAHRSYVLFRSLFPLRNLLRCKISLRAPVNLRSLTTKQLACCGSARSKTLPCNPLGGHPAVTLSRLRLGLGDPRVTQGPPKGHPGVTQARPKGRFVQALCLQRKLEMTG